MSTKAELLKRIKLQCQECMGSTVARKGELDGQAGGLVEGCTAPDCSLFPFRQGKDPWKVKKGNTDNLRKMQIANSVRRNRRQISTISKNE